MRFIPQVWQAKISLPRKIQASLHLTGYGIHILMFVLAVSFPALIILPERFPGIHTLFSLALIFNLTTFAPLFLTLAAQRQLGRRWTRVLPGSLLLTILGAGMILNTVRGAAQILLRRRDTFERTPKFGVSHKKDSWTKRRYQLNVDSIVLSEIGFALYNLGTAIFAVSERNWGIAVYASIFFLGLAFTSGLTIVQALQVWAQNRKTPEPARFANLQSTHQRRFVQD